MTHVRHNVKYDNEQAPDCIEKCWCLRTLTGLLFAAARLLPLILAVLLLVVGTGHATPIDQWTAAMYETTWSSHVLVTCISGFLYSILHLSLIHI